MTSKLESAARATLAAHGADKEAIVTYEVPGAFELPLVCLKAAESGNFEAVIALGVVIRGETPHFEYVAGQAARGIINASMQTGIPVMFGVITADNLSQVVDRAGDNDDNKGHEAALAAIEMVNLLQKIASQGGHLGRKTFPHVV